MNTKQSACRPPPGLFQAGHFIVPSSFPAETCGWRSHRAAEGSPPGPPRDRRRASSCCRSPNRPACLKKCTVAIQVTADKNAAGVYGRKYGRSSRPAAAFEYSALLMKTPSFVCGEIRLIADSVTFTSLISPLPFHVNDRK